MAPAVPSSVEKLVEYEEVLNETEFFHEFLTGLGFLASSNLSLLNYARNVDALFANKLCQVGVNSNVCLFYRFIRLILMVYAMR